MNEVITLHKTDLRAERTKDCKEILTTVNEFIDESGGCDEVLIWVRYGTVFRRFNTPVDDVVNLIGRIEMHKDDLMQWMRE